MRYDRTYATLANRAVRQATISIEAFVERLLDSGMSIDRINEQLEFDLETGGPLFAPFKRAMVGAATSAVKVAQVQASLAGEIVGNPKTLSKMAARLSKEFKTQVDPGVIREKLENLAEDPRQAETLEQLEQMSADEMYVWECALVKTCHRCLPLHGKIMTLEDWQSRGLHPSTIHAGWASTCQCTLVLAENAESFKDMREPLVRNTVVQEGKRGKKTIRGVTGADRERALLARDEAMKTPEGRRALRLLGETNKPPEEKE